MSGPDIESNDPLQRYQSRLSQFSEQDVLRQLSRRKTDQPNSNESNEFNALLEEIFDRDEMKKKNVGVIFKDFTVEGEGSDTKPAPTVNLFKKKGGKETKTLINSFNGCVRDGEMLLVLGQPGSGCTTFLKALANQRNSFKSVSGEVQYGGIGWKEMAEKYRGEVVYNSEDDLHYATLTVEQTLRFALKTRTPKERRQGESRLEYQNKFLNVLGQIFGISHTFNTKVGNELIRGVSGGEKKRVSIAEVFVNRASVGCWDNSTRGLDASTAVEYCRSLRVLTNIAKVSTVVTIYQAGEQLYDFFDKVLLIDQGKCIYYGPTEKAKKYFEDLGFEAASRSTTADFLTSITDPRARIVKGEPPADLEQAYKESAIFKEMMEDIEDFRKHSAEDHLDDQMRKKESKTVYQLSFAKQVWYCTIRQYQIAFGDKISLIGKNVSAIFQALIIGSLFYNAPADTNGAFLRGGILFFSLLFNALLSLAELSGAFFARPILMKHKSFTFFRPSAYAVAQVVADIPQIFLQIACFDIVIYFLSGLQRTPSQFFINFLFLYFTTLSTYAFFRMLGSLVPSLDAATALSGLAIQALIVYAGYIIPRPTMHPWLYWLWYINPIAYGFEALMVNEFYNLELECVPPRLVPYVGSSQGCAIAGSTPGSTVVNGAAYISESFTYVRGHLWRNLAFIIMFWLFFVLVTCIGTERLKPFSAGGGTLLYVKKKEKEVIEKAASDASSTIEGLKSESTFTWKNICYSVKVKKEKRQLLDNVTGWVKPGRLTCLVGASGAGKTTLLNTLAQRHSGDVTGEMRVGGQPLPSTFQRSTGYCEQMDLHEPTSTVREALQFSALLRQKSPYQEKMQYVEEIIKLLEMERFADAIIGEPGDGLTVEQRKRVTLGVELASKPSLLLFLDEPTSGLDSQAAWNIVRFLRKLAEAGQALLVTIHQPSAILFNEFDDILLLGPGGKTIYFGELSKMIDYFQNNGSEKCPKNANPAEWVLDVVGAGGGIGAKKAQKDWPQIWKDSEEAKAVVHEIDNTTSKDIQFDTDKYAMPYSTQIAAVTKRIFVSYWRTPQYAIGKMMLHITTGLFNCFTFFQLGQSVQDQQNRVFSLFLVLTIAPPLIQQLQPRYLAYRALFKGREQQSQIYSYVSFVIGSILVEIPYSIICGTIYFFCWYFGPGFPREIERAGAVWLFLMLFELFYVTFGIFIAAMAPNEIFASLLVPTFFSFIIAFCGVLSPPSAMPYFWRSWMYPLTPFHYLLEALLTFVVHENVVVCAENEYARFTSPSGTCQDYVGSFVEQYGGYLRDPLATACEYCQFATGDEYAASLQVYWGNRYRDYGILWAYVIFNIGLIFVLTYIYTHKFRS